MSSSVLQGTLLPSSALWSRYRGLFCYFWNTTAPALDLCTCCLPYPAPARKLGVQLSTGLFPHFFQVLTQKVTFSGAFPQPRYLKLLKRFSPPTSPPQHAQMNTTRHFIFCCSLFPLSTHHHWVYYIFLSCDDLSHPLECKLHAGREGICFVSLFVMTQSLEVRTVPGT